MRKSILNILAFLGGGVLLSLVALLEDGRSVFDYSLPTSLLLLLGGLGGISVRIWLLQRWRSREREADLALVVRTVRRIHLLQAERKNRDELLNGICRILVDDGYCFSAWLALVNRQGALLCCSEVFQGEEFPRRGQGMESGVFPVCAKKALSREGLVVSDQTTSCAGCPHAADGADRVCFTVRVSHQGQIYGLLGVSVSASREHELGERMLLGEIAQDVGQALYLAELEAQRVITENRFRELVENSQAGILLIQDNAVIYRNPEQKRLFGPLPAHYRPDAFAGVHPDDLEKVESAYGRVSRGEVASVDLDFRFYPQQKDDGGKGMKWVFCRASRIDYQGRDTVLVSMVDITRNKELEHLVRVQDKMSSLGRVAAGIAHEIRNPLSGINIYLDTLGKIHERKENLETVGEIISQAQAASRKIESVIRRVMDFSKPSQPRLVMVDVNQPVENALLLCAAALRRDAVGLEKDLACDLPRCSLDTSLIEQVIINLLTNAAEALSHSEVKRISVRTALEKEAVVIRVGDSGPGIPEGLRNKIFEPFYTTKSDGTGIGLSLCRRIIGDHHGTLTVEESVWGGAEFVITLTVNSEQEGYIPGGGCHGAV
ncbi:MAG: ATP-binding protein [Desulfobulbaceae bacterium]|nr:ATP-binding protein [Desulfobulbaceae bacterium]HIJ89569.1 PAS domain S-box protein [Deltaproteobacteria bacterium]